MTSEIRFTVLTRMSRPRYFATCRQSVVSQLHRPVRHLVAVDDEANLGAVAGLDVVRVERRAPDEASSFPANLYFNALYPLVDDGWVVFLDDDDVFTGPWCLSDLADAIRARGDDPHTMYLWKVWFPGWGRVVPTRTFGIEPTLYDVNTASVCFHARHLAAATWDGNRAGDFRVIDRLYRTVPRTVWLDRVFTAQQVGENVGNPADRPPDLELLRPADGLSRLCAAHQEALRALDDARAELARLRARPPDEGER